MKNGTADLSIFNVIIDRPCVYKLISEIKNVTAISYSENKKKQNQIFG